MAKITLLRGKDTAIKAQDYTDGQLFLSKDRYKLYADYGEFRNELNCGICLQDISIQFEEDSNSALIKLQIDEPIDFSQSNFIFQIYGKDLCYLVDKVYCDSIQYKDSQNYLSFKREAIELFSFAYTVDIFIYDAVLNTRKNIIPDQNTYIAKANSWTGENGQYSTTAEGGALGTNQISLVSQANTTSNYYAVNDATIDNNGALILNATYKPIEDIWMYVQQLPTDFTGVELTIPATNWAEDPSGGGAQQIDCNGLTEDSIILVQFLNNKEEQALIQSITPTNNGIAIIAKYLTQKDITINVIDLTDKVKIQEITIPKGEWSVDNTTHLQAAVRLINSLVCGSEGDLVPIISCIENDAEFNNIYGITINEAKDVLTAHSYYPIKNDIIISIVDFQ